MDWEAYGKLMGVCVQSAGFETKAELWSGHGEWQISEQRSEGEALGNINQARVAIKNHLPLLLLSCLTLHFQFPLTPPTHVMDINQIVAWPKNNFDLQ